MNLNCYHETASYSIFSPIFYSHIKYEVKNMEEKKGGHEASPFNSSAAADVAVAARLRNFNT